MGHSFTGPSIHDPTDQHNYTGHLQLAQQLIGVMGHSSSGLTLFGPSTLHFYQGPPLENDPVSPSPPTPIHHSAVSPSSTPPLHSSNVSGSSFLPDYPHSLTCQLHYLHPPYSHAPSTTFPNTHWHVSTSHSSSLLIHCIYPPQAPPLSSKRNHSLPSLSAQDLRLFQKWEVTNS